MNKLVKILLAVALGFGLPLAAQQGPVGYTNTGLPVYFAAAPAYGYSQSVTSALSITSTSFVTTGLVMPSIAAGSTVHGSCDITYEQATAAGGVSFGTAMSNAPTDLWIQSRINTSAAGAVAVTYTAQTATTATIVGASATPGAIGTPYYASFDFVLQAGALPVVVTWEALTASGSDALTIEPGSHCGWTY